MTFEPFWVRGQNQNGESRDAGSQPLPILLSLDLPKLIALGLAQLCRHTLQHISMTKRLELKLFFSLKQLKKPKVLNGTHRFVEAETNSNFFFHKNSSCFFETLEHESGPKIGESEQQEQLLRQVFSEQLAAGCQRRQQRPQQVSGRNKTDTLAEKSQHFHSQARLTISKHPRSLDRSTDRTAPE